MVRGARARTLAPTSSGMGSRGQECPRHMGWLPPFAQNAKGWRTKLSSRSLCQHERGRSRLTLSGTESRGQEGSAPHVRTGLSTADCSRLKPLGMTMRKGSCSAPSASLRAGSRTEVVPFPECSRARAPAPRNTSAPLGLHPNQSFAVVEGWAAICPSHSLSFGSVARCVPPTEKPRPRSPVSEYNFSCQFSVASYQFIERIWVRREAALLFCSLRVTTAVIDGGVLQF